MDKEAFKIDGQKDIRDAQESVLSPSSLSGWVLLGYSDANTVVLQAKGTGGVDELVKHIQEDQVQYAVIRLEEKDKDIANVNRQDGKKATRDIFITWLGPQIRTVERGKKSLHGSAVAKFMSPYHAEITAVNKAKFNEANVRDRAAALSGSHVID